MKNADTSITNIAIQNMELITALILLVTAIISLVAALYKNNKQKRKIELLELARKENLAFDAIFLNVEAVKSEIFSLIEHSKDNYNPLEIDNFGLDLETIVPMFRYTFTKKLTQREIIYRGLIIDPDPDKENIKRFCVDKSNISQSIASDSIEKVRDIIQRDETSASIQIKSYDQPPVIHGFLVDGEHLFISFTNFGNNKFKNKGLLGGTSPYIHVKKDGESEFKNILFSTYTSWFDYWWRNGKDQV